MKVMFTVQGDGRGHMTQAIAVAEMLQRRGHEVCAVLAGGFLAKPLPEFFEKAFPVKVERIASPGFHQTKKSGVSLSATMAQVVTNLPTYRRSLKMIGETIRRAKPNVIVSFLEPLMGLYNLFNSNATPTLAVGHQFMLEHPSYPKSPHYRMQQLGMRQYVRITGARSSRLALSFYPAPKLQGAAHTVCPPILRRQLFELKPTKGDYLLVYLLFHGLSEQITRWAEANPSVPVHCFCDRPNAPAEEMIRPNLTFHRLHGEKFLSMMAGCRGVVCTAGFESISEAAYLGKPLLMTPVQDHVEQFLNAKDAEKAGLGMCDTTFNLTRLLDAQSGRANADFVRWVDQAEEITIGAIEECANGRTQVEEMAAEPRA